MVLVGDTGVGKSCLITNYLYNQYTDVYEPTVLDVYKGNKSLELGGGKSTQIKLEIHDTSGDDHIGQKRKVVYQGADIFMICVACNARDSYQNIEKWRDEIMAAEPKKPIMLILCKSDIKDKEVTEKDLKDKQKEDNKYIGVKATSSKEYDDHNVIKAFKFTLKKTFEIKYAADNQ